MGTSGMLILGLSLLTIMTWGSLERRAAPRCASSLGRWGRRRPGKREYPPPRGRSSRGAGWHWAISESAAPRNLFVRATFPGPVLSVCPESYLRRPCGMMLVPGEVAINFRACPAHGLAALLPHRRPFRAPRLAVPLLLAQHPVRRLRQMAGDR